MNKRGRIVKCFIIAIVAITTFYTPQVTEADEVVSIELVGVEDTGIIQESLPAETEMPENIAIVQDEGSEDVEESDVQDIIVEEMEFGFDETESDIMSQEMTEELLDDEENIQKGTEKNVDSELTEISLGEDGLEVDLSEMISPAPVSLTIYDMLGIWEGRYSYEADNETECSFLLNISDCTDDGKINGYAEIGTQEVAGFFFDGTVDFQSGSISFAVTEWLDNPQDLTSEIFSGTVDVLSMEMTGIVNSDENSSFKLSKTLDDYGTMMMQSDAGEEEIPDYDIWLANTLISGFENDGNGLYRVFRNTFGEPVYSLMGAHLMEDEPLVTISTAWSVYFNSEYRNQFVNEQKYIYEVILMEYLKYDSDSSARKIDLYNNEMKFSIKLFSAITKGVSGSRKDYLNSMTSEEALRFYDNLDWADDLSSALSELKTGYSTVKELINGISEYKALEQVRDERVALLKAARDACASSSSPNRDFIQAVNELISMIEGSKLQYIQGKSLDYLLEQDLNFLWGQLCNANPVLSGIEFGISGLDMCFDSTNRASNDLKLALLYTVDQYMKMGMMNASTSYLDEKTSKNAQTFIACFEAYVQFQMYGNKFISTWLNDYLDGGIFSDIINMVFYQENIQTAEELLSLSKSQIENREHLLGRISDWADLYEGLYKPAEWDDFQSNVPVTGVTFSEPSYTVGRSTGVFVHAQIQPENATNKNIIYSSSNPAILEVSSEGGFATIHGPGTVTITARTEEGNFVAYQNITIEDRVAVTFRGEGSCGENVKWRLTSDGTLYIYGKGDMQDYNWFYEDRYNNLPWGHSEIKEIIIAEGVTSIGDYAFEDCGGFTSVSIPEGVTSIGDGAFQYCYGLTSVSIPEGVTGIGKHAFSECDALINVGISEGVTSIGEGAFRRCISLVNISIPEGVTSIGDYVFYNCSNLTSVNIPEGVTSIGDYAFGKCSSLTSVSIPERVTSIGKYAFYYCDSLASVSISKEVTSIGDYVFYNCSNLTSVNIPEGVTRIGYSAFQGCSSLTSVSIPEGVTRIESWIFSGCSNLTNVSIPKRVKSIGDGAFSGCSKLASVSIPEGVTRIGYSAFQGCSSLTSVGIPESVNSIGDYAFGYWRDIEKIDGFTIIGKKDSAAEKYAIENDIIFIDYSENPIPSIQPGTESNPPQMSGESNASQPGTEENTSHLETENGASGTSVTKINVASISLNASAIAIMKDGNTKLLATALPIDAANQTLMWSSSDESIAKIDGNGVVTGMNYGTAIITVAATDGSGAKAQCRVTVGYGITYKLNGGSNSDNNPAAYYKQGVSLKNPSKKGYLFKGWYTDKKCKKKLTKISASSKKNLTIYAKWEKIKLGKPTVKSLKNSSGKKAILKYKKVSKADGYEVVYGTDRKLKRNCKSVSTKKTTVTLKKLTKGKTYYVKVRAYRKDSAGKKVYGKYSAVKKVNVKK